QSTGPIRRSRGRRAQRNNETANLRMGPPGWPASATHLRRTQANTRKGVAAATRPCCNRSVSEEGPSGSPAPARSRRRHFSMIRDFQVADFFTLGNAFCGTAAVLATMKYLVLGDPRYLWLAFGALPVAFACDVLDGRVARR